MNTQDPIVFISCGQRTEPERQLGRDICALVRELTPFRPYFADNQSTLEGLTSNILQALDRASGFIAVYHRRGLVAFSDAPDAARFHLGSVWIEQEVAVAAYLTQVAGRSFPVAAFVEDSIQREGMREQLLLNPHSFTTPTDVLAILRALLPTWQYRATSAPSAPVQLLLSVSKGAMCAGGVSFDALMVDVQNDGSEPLEDYRLELQVPPDLVNPGISYRGAVSGRPGFFRATAQDHRRPQLFPGDPLRIFRFDFAPVESGGVEKKAVATFFSKGHAPVRAEMFLTPVTSSHVGT